jgi:hypothetical protein
LNLPRSIARIFDMAVCSYQKGKENPLIAYKAFKGHTANMVSAGDRRLARDPLLYCRHGPS